MLACIKFCPLIHFVTYSLKLFIDDRLVVKRRDEMEHEDEDISSHFTTRRHESSVLDLGKPFREHHRNFMKRCKYFVVSLGFMILSCCGT